MLWKELLRAADAGFWQNFVSAAFVLRLSEKPSLISPRNHQFAKTQIKKRREKNEP